MKIKGQLEWTDYLNSQLLHMRLGSFGTIALYGMLAVMVFGLIGGLFLAADGIFSIATMIPAFVLVVLVVLYRYAFLPQQIKKIFFQQKELSLPFEMEITETGIVASNELGNGIRPWVNFIKWKEDKAYLLLYHSDIMYTIIPKRLFPDPQQVETIKAYLEKNKIPTVKSQRRTTGIVIYFLLLIVIATMLYMGVYPQHASSEVEETPTVSTIRSRNTEAAAIYSLLLNNHISGRNPIMIANVTLAGTFFDDELILRKAPLLDKGTLTDFRLVNQRSQAINLELSLNRDFVFVGIDRSDWEANDLKYPNSDLSVSFSSIGFNEELNQALVYIEQFHTSDYGRSDLYF